MAQEQQSSASPGLVCRGVLQQLGHELRVGSGVLLSLCVLPNAIVRPRFCQIGSDKRPTSVGSSQTQPAPLCRPFEPLSGAVLVPRLIAPVDCIVLQPPDSGPVLQERMHDLEAEVMGGGVE